MIAEAVGFLGGAGVGATVKLVTKVLDRYHEASTQGHQERKATIAANAKATASARAFAESFKGGALARRFIVLTVFTYLFVFPFWAALRGIPVSYAYQDDGAGLFNWLFGWGDGTKFKTVEGFTIFPFQTVIASTVAGFYFGAGVVK